MKITAAGKYSIQGPISGKGGATSIVLISGSGGGTLTLGYYDDFDTFIPFTDGIVTSPSQTTVKHGVGIRPILDVSTGGAALSVITAGHS